jgi:hypothetical protein
MATRLAWFFLGQNDLCCGLGWSVVASTGLSSACLAFLAFNRRVKTRGYV